MENPNYTVGIVGGGVIGLTIALSLQTNGVQCILLDKDAVGHGASWGNAGHLATEQVFPVADASVLAELPKMLFDPLGPLRIDWRYLPQLTPWGLKLLNNMRTNNFQHIHRSLTLINAVSLDAWKRLISHWKLEHLVKIQGSLQVSEKSKTLEKIKKSSDYLNEIGVKCEFVDHNQLQEIAPNLSTSQLGGIFYPDTGHVINLEKLLNSFKSLLLKNGGTICEHEEVLSITNSGDHYQIHLSDRVITTNKVVLCAGAYSKKFAKQLTNITVPLETERGYHLMLPNESQRFNVPISSADRRFIMTPMSEGLRLAGTVEYAGLKLPPNMQRAHNLVTLANGMLKEPLDIRNNREWMGFRPTIADSLPIIDHKGNCFLAFGHQHLGLTHAAITAELITQQFFQQRTAIDCRAFSIDRFA